MEHILDENRNVLVVEDDPVMRELLGEALSARNHVVHLFSNGTDAAKAFQNETFPLVLLDWKLPDISGLDLCRNFRQMPNSSFVSILMITGNKAPEHLRLALEAGADDYLTKPFPLSLLDIRLTIAEENARQRRKRAQAEEALIRAQQLAAVGTLAAGVAHEFNNIHTSVIGFLQLILSSYEMEQEAREYLERVLSSANRAVSITKNLLTFSRMNQTERKATDLNEIVKDTMGIVSEEIRSDGITLQTELQNIPEVIADESQIGQVVMNLLINSRHALLGKTDKKILISTGHEESRCFIRVEDNGCGIPEEHISKMFLPFFSTKGEHSGTDSVQSAVRGTGLGLSVCDTIARNHGGEITVESEEDKGSIFTLYLPSTQDAPASIPAQMPKAAVPVPPASKGRVLVLDDEKDIRDLLGVVLDRKGYTVSTSASGLDSAKVHEECPFDIVLLDLQMPEINGYEFVELLTRSKQPVPAVIIITGCPEKIDISSIGDIVPEKVVLKPFDIQTLIQDIEKTMEKRKSGQEALAGK